jgi:Predicted membrane protein
MLVQLESSLTCFLTGLLIVLLTIFIFTRVTKYNDWKEIAEGNTAAALALGGKVLGVANIIRFSVLSSTGAAETIFWGLTGAVMLILVYLLFEWLTPKLNVNREIASRNTAVGLLSMIFSVAASFIIGASIS